MTATTEPPDILSSEFASNPYPIYRILRDEFPLFWHEGMQSYVVSRYEDVERAFKDPSVGSENYDWQLEPVHGRTILQMEGAEHSTKRALIAPAFRGRGLEKLLPAIHENSTSLIDDFRTDGRVDLVGQYATKYPINVIVDMLGLPKSDMPLFHGWYTSIMAFLSNLSQDPDITAAGLKTKAEFEAHMIPIIQERRRDPGDDLLSELCHAEIDGTAMTDQEIHSFCSLLVTGGGETTDKGFASLFASLVANPDQMAAVREDRSLVAPAFAEALRHTPPIHMIMRQPKEDIEFSGGVVESGKTVTCLIGAANRDERCFSEPDTFDIARTDLDDKRAYSAAANHLAFAKGRHFCVGSILAKTEIEIGINDLLDSMGDVRFADGVPPTERGVFTRGPEALNLEFTPT